MTTLNVQAVITAVDRLTGPLAAMGAKVGGLQNRFNSAASAASGMGMAAGMAAGGLIYALTSGQRELDAALRQFQVVGNASDDVRVKMRGGADDLAVRLGMPQLDLIQGATEMLQAGLGTEDLLSAGQDGITLLQSMGEAAKVAGQPIAELATDLVTLAKSFGMPWGNPEERGKALKDLMGLAIVAPRLSPDSPGGHIRALKEFGPIASQLGMTPLEASALQNTLSSAGFREQLGGMGMKSILQRLLNPTKAAQAQMSVAGFNYGRVFNNNLAGLNADKFVDAMEVAGLDAGGAKGFISSALSDAVKQGGKLDLLCFKAQMSKGIAKALGIKKNDTWNSAVVKTAVDDIIAGTGTGINTTAFLEELSKLPVAAFKDVAGLHHASKMAVLRFQESLKQYLRNLEQTAAQMPTAVAEGFGVKSQGWAYQLDRMAAAWQRFRNALWDSGGGDTWTSIVEKIGTAFDSLATMDPAKLSQLSNGLSQLAVGLGALAGASAGVWALARLGAILSGPAGQLLLAGGLAQWLGVLDGHSAQHGANGSIVGGMSDSAALLSSLQQLSNTALELGSTLGGVVAGFTELGGVNLNAGGVTSVLGVINELVKEINGGLGKLNSWLKGDADTSFGDVASALTGLKYDPERAFWNRAWKGGKNTWDWWWNGGDPLGTGSSQPGAPSTPINRGGAGQPIAPIGQAPAGPPPVARLEGSGTVTVNVKVEGPGTVTGISAADDGKNLKLKTGGGMGDTNK